MNWFQQAANPGILRLAPYQPGMPVETLERDLGITNIVKLASNENPLGPTPKLVDHLASILADSARYPDGSAYQLKGALSKKFGISTDALTIGNGSNDVLELLARVFLRPGLNVVVPEHAFVVYGLVTASLGASLIEVPCQTFTADLDAMLSKIDADTRMVFLANPNNPTGTWIKRDALEAFLAAVPTTTIVVLDEAYVEYVDDPAYPNGLKYLDQYPNLVVTRTFSKAYGLAALSLGYAVSHPEIADLMNRIRQPFNVNSTALAAGLIALEDSAHVEHGVQVNRDGLRALVAGFDRLGLPYIPSVANFISVDFGQDVGPIYQALLKEGVIVRPIGVYGMPHHLRVSVGTQAENQFFLAALDRVLAAG